MSTTVREAYARAEAFLPWNVEKRVFRMGVEPHWIGDAERFWRRTRTREGVEFVLVDPEARTRAPAFDHVRLAAALSVASGTATTHAALPFESLKIDGDIVRFYDAMYVALADDMRCPLLDWDRKLHAALSGTFPFTLLVGRFVAPG